MDKFVNLGQVQDGRLPDGWRKSLLSPFGKVISEEDWEKEGRTDSDLDFKQQTRERQQAIKTDFTKFFEELGEGFLVLDMNEPHPFVEDQEYFEPLMEPFVRQENLTCFIDGFLTQDRTKFVFHLRRECFVQFGFDMSVWVYHRNPLPKMTNMKVLKLVEV